MSEGLKLLLPEDDILNEFFSSEVRPPPQEEEYEDQEDKNSDEKDKWAEFQRLEHLKLYEKIEHPNNNYHSNISDIESTVMGATTTNFSIGRSVVEEQYKPSTTNRGPLPVDRFREQILQLVEDNPVLVLSGHTGCGKTTQVPQFILDKKYGRREPVNIIVTQPRKIAAKSIAQRVCKERGLPLGTLVGYHVGLDKMNKSPDTKLLYVTTGVLKQMLINDNNQANSFTHIILDEVHERDLDTDFILLFLKKLMFTTHAKFKLILMSATIDENKFIDYFSQRIDGKTVPAPWLNVGSSSLDGTKHVQVAYLDTLNKETKFTKFSIDEPNLSEEAVEECLMTIEKLPKVDKKYGAKGAVLIFLPGIFEIARVQKLLEERIKKENREKMEIIPLHSSIPWEDHERIFKTSSDFKGLRKVILSTNIAESSITLSDICYVFDFCLTKRLETDPATGYPQLNLCWASRQQLEQRKGRVGRVGPGLVFRLITEKFEKELEKEQSPDMVRVPLTKLVLEIKMCNFGSPLEMLAIAMQPPETRKISAAILDLKLIGALLPTLGGVDSNEDGDITVLGEIVAHLPVDVLLGKLIVLGFVFGLLEECCIIAAGLNGKSMFSKYFSKKLKSYMSKLKWADSTGSDFKALLQAYKTWEDLTEKGSLQFRSKRSENKDADFYSNYNLERKQLVEMQLLIKEIKSGLKYMKIETPVNKPTSKHSIDQDLLLDIVIFGAFYPNYFIKGHFPDRLKEAHRLLDKQDPLRTIYFSNFPHEHAKIGKIYEKSIRILLEDVVPKSQINQIQFDGSKVLVNFKTESSENPNSENIIPSVVLIAIKFGKLNRRDHRGTGLELKKYQLAKGEKVLQELRSKSSGRATSKIKIAQLKAPDMKRSKVTFRVLHVESPHSFHVVLEDNYDDHSSIAKIIKDDIASCPMIATAQNLVGNFCLAPFQDFGYYRVRVEGVTDRGVKVFYLDWGNTGIVRANCLREIPLDLHHNLNQPALAVECSLVRIQPAMHKKVMNYWDKEAVYKFQALVDDSECRGEIYSDIPCFRGVNKYLLKLNPVVLTKVDGNTVDLRQWLVDEGLAESADESYLSTQRCLERKEFAAQNKEMQDYLNNPDRYQQEEEELYEGGQIDFSMDSIKLKGPSSPLETSVSSANLKNFNNVRIEEDSVNSVLLDNNPSLRQNVWMVAAHVGARSGTSNEIIVRNTSWLPPRPGIGPLMAMIFAPRVQLRVNKSKTNFTGCLLGLGCSKIPIEKGKYKPLYPQHDMEIKFDCRVGMDEVLLIDCIRHNLGELLSRGPEGFWRLHQMSFFHKSQEEMKEKLSILLGKELAFKEMEWCHSTLLPNVWKGGFKLNNSSIYKRLEIPQLEKISIQMASFISLASEESTAFKNTAYCPACSKSANSGLEVSHHLVTQEHRDSLHRVERFD